MTRVQEHLIKIFEGIERVKFEEEFAITGLQSTEEEKVELVDGIKPLDSEGEVRQVEEWLKELERSMKRTVKEGIVASSK